MELMTGTEREIDDVGNVGIRTEEHSLRSQMRNTSSDRLQYHLLVIVTDKGLKVQPQRVRAIIDVPKPTDTAGVQRLLGIVQHLEKVLPHLSSVIQPLRELTQKDVEFVWQHVQQSLSARCRVP